MSRSRKVSTFTAVTAMNAGEVKFVYGALPYSGYSDTGHDQPFLSLACCRCRSDAGSTALLLLPLGDAGLVQRPGPAEPFDMLLRVLPGACQARQEAIRSPVRDAAVSMLLHLPDACIDDLQASRGW
jgi:hypothetical protein